jgi:2-dehydro-3-deoxygluconokinase
LSRFDILALGEAMLEFNQTGAGDGRLYLQGFGGDTSNFAVAAARQGARVGYISAVGDDRHGRMLREMWAAEGVDASAVMVDPAAHTGIYFVSHDAEGHHFAFMRRGSAASRITPALLPRHAIRSARVLHVSGISLAISASARATCHAAMALARDAGVLISFDTNMRAALWPVEPARREIEAAIAACDVCLPSDSDLAALTGIENAEAMVDHCLALGAKTVALKRGAAGALVADALQRHHISAWPCIAVDATGAGDVFGGAFVARRLAGDSLEAAGRYAAVAAALSTRGYGAIAPIPGATEVLAALAGRGS